MEKYNKYNYMDAGRCLSVRQVDVLKQLANGLSNKQIAYNLGVAEATIKMHISALLRFFNVQNRTQILLKAKEKGWI